MENINQGIAIKRCVCCVMDNSDDKDLTFDENGVCDRCNEFLDVILPYWNYGKGHEDELEKLISEIKKSGKNKEYDCLLGLSGGLDSSYMLYKAVKDWRLKPYVLHIDAGWDSEVTKSNISKLVDTLGVKLHTVVLDKDEYREMQLAWFRTGLASLDAPQDHSFIALVDKYSQRIGVKYILNGYNISTEVIADPKSWDEGAGHTGDKTFMKDVIKRYCNIPIKKYVFTSGFKHKFYIPFIKRIKTVKPLNLIPITRKEMIDTLEKECGYVYYGQKHFENIFTKFLEGWWLPNKFGFDIRKSQLSSLVVTGQMSRENALNVLSKPAIKEKEATLLFQEVAMKLNISCDELQSYYDLPKTNIKFKTHSKFYDLGIKIYEKIGLEKRIRK